MTNPTCVKMKNLKAAYRRFGPPQIPMRKNIGMMTSSQKTAKSRRSRDMKTPTRVISRNRMRLKPRAMIFAARWDVPTNQATTAPTRGTKMRRLRMYVISSTQPRPPTLEESQSEHERDDHDDPEDDDPRVALDLSGLSLPQPQTAPHGLEADRVHGSVDDPAIESVGPCRDHDAGAADPVHDAIDDLAVEPVDRAGHGVHDGPSERVVRIVDPVPFRQHAMDEGAAPGCGEAFRGDPLRRVHGPGEGEARGRDAHRDPFEDVVRQRDAHEREASLGPPEEDEVPEALHRIREEAGDEREASEDHHRHGHDGR